MRIRCSPAARVTSKSCSVATGRRPVSAPITCQLRNLSRAARALSRSWSDFQGASKARAFHTESRRSISTSRSAGVRPEATSSASTCTTLPKLWAVVAGVSAFTSRPRNHCRAQVLASWSSALPERTTGWSRSRRGTLLSVGSYMPHQREGWAAGASGRPSSSVRAASLASLRAAASRRASEARGSTVVARSSATRAATDSGRRGRPVTSRGSTPSSVRKREGWSPSSAGALTAVTTRRSRARVAAT